MRAHNNNSNDDDDHDHDDEKKHKCKLNYINKNVRQSSKWTKPKQRNRYVIEKEHKVAEKKKSKQNKEAKFKRIYETKCMYANEKKGVAYGKWRCWLLNAMRTATQP